MKPEVRTHVQGMLAARAEVSRDAAEQAELAELPELAEAWRIIHALDKAIASELADDAAPPTARQPSAQDEHTAS